jgi:hypothetical protein
MYFTRAIQNNSETYNCAEWNRRSRVQAARHVKSDTREQPKPQEEVATRPIKIICPPAGLILFYGAHLHETVSNGMARYSIDFRTVYYDEAVAHLGAVRRLATHGVDGAGLSPLFGSAPFAGRVSDLTRSRRPWTRYCFDLLGAGAEVLMLDRSMPKLVQHPPPENVRGRWHFVVVDLTGQAVWMSSWEPPSSPEASGTTQS